MAVLILDQAAIARSAYIAIRRGRRGRFRAAGSLCDRQRARRCHCRHIRRPRRVAGSQVEGRELANSLDERLCRSGRCYPAVLAVGVRHALKESGTTVPVSRAHSDHGTTYSQLFSSMPSQSQGPLTKQLSGGTRDDDEEATGAAAVVPLKPSVGTGVGARSCSDRAVMFIESRTWKACSRWSRAEAQS